jgi:pyruvate formate lyase activating enzyme
MEALFYNKLGHNKVECSLCPHYCNILPNHVGICRARKNNDGVLETIAYGRICSVAVDPIEKKPLYHFLPGSKTFSIAIPGCNFKCSNCQNDGISQHSIEDTNTSYISPEDVVEQASECGSISYTYTEPLIFFEYVYDTAKLAKGKGIKNIIVSNGYINERPLKMLAPYLDAANIDLKCFDEKVHQNLTKGKLDVVLI